VRASATGGFGAPEAALDPGASALAKAVSAQVGCHVRACVGDLDKEDTLPSSSTWPKQVRTIRSVNLSESALMSLSKAGRTKHHQGFDRPASFAEITVNLEIDVQRMRLDFCKSGFDAANRAWVSRL
jgi:hypothetical protein